jgi:hypothetical protein
MRHLLTELAAPTSLPQDDAFVLRGTADDAASSTDKPTPTLVSSELSERLDKIVAPLESLARHWADTSSEQRPDLAVPLREMVAIVQHSASRTANALRDLELRLERTSDQTLSAHAALAMEWRKSLDTFIQHGSQLTEAVLKADARANAQYSQTADRILREQGLFFNSLQSQMERALTSHTESLRGPVDALTTQVSEAIQLHMSQLAATGPALVALHNASTPLVSMADQCARATAGLQEQTAALSSSLRLLNTDVASIREAAAVVPQIAHRTASDLEAIDYLLTEFIVLARRHITLLAEQYTPEGQR